MIATCMAKPTSNDMAPTADRRRDRKGDEMSDNKPFGGSVGSNGGQYATTVQYGGTAAAPANRPPYRAADGVSSKR